jgi:hypothetical protein
MMGWNWHNYEQEWQRRRKNSDEKRMWRDVRLTKDQNGTFHLDYMPMHWIQLANGKHKRERIIAYPLAKITADNVLTVLYESRPDITICNRLTEIIGRPVWSDVSHHRNKEQTVRIRPAKWNRTRQQYEIDSWCPSGVHPTNWAHGTIPYKTGLMFQLDNITGDPISLLTPVEDITIAVKNEAIQRTKADTKVLRVLLRGMARMGTFDEWLDQKLERGWVRATTSLDQVNYKEPLGSDASTVFLHGLSICSAPGMSHYVGNTWTRRTPQERREMLMSAAIDNGMRALRKHIYSTTDGYERIVK